MEQHLGWIQLSISIVVDVQWKIHVHGLHSCLCAKWGPKSAMVELDKIYV
jgi:hypothetical protein